MNSSTKFILALFCIFIFVIGINFLDVALGFALLPWHTVTSQVQSGHEVIDKTYNADNAIYNYEWFKSQYEEIKATENKITNTQTQMDEFVTLNGNDTSKWDYQNKQSYGQLQTTLTGQKSYYEDQVAEYNARSQMANRAVFKDSLPAHVDNTLENTKL
jgi:hypothetical protein